MANSLTGFHSLTRAFSGTSVVLALCFSPTVFGQDRDHDRDWEHSWDRNRNVYTMLPAGAVLAVRTQEPIDVERTNNRVFNGIIDQDVRGDNGRIAIPRGAHAELIVRVARDNDMTLDLESVVVNGQRYGVRTEPNRVESQSDNSIVGSILGAINGGEMRGRAVRIPNQSVVTFRLQQPLQMGVADRGVDRDGNHYHDYYGDRH